jgi:hypothetical protein
MAAVEVEELLMGRLLVQQLLEVLEHLRRVKMVAKVNTHLVLGQAVEAVEVLVLVVVMLVFLGLVMVVMELHLL